MPTYEELSPEEKATTREGALLSAAKDAWYIIIHASEYVDSGVYESTEQAYEHAARRLKGIIDFVESNHV